MKRCRHPGLLLMGLLLLAGGLATLGCSPQTEGADAPEKTATAAVDEQAAPGLETAAGRQAGEAPVPSPWPARWSWARTTGGRLVIASFFALFGLLCVLAVPFSFPGTWVLILMALVIEVSDLLWLPEGERQTFSWLLLGLCFLLALLGELVEFAGSAVGAGRAGSTRWGMAGAIAGGVAGAITGAFFPPPVIASLVGALVGAFLGALVAEVLFGKVGLRESMRPALGAAVGRALGGVGKAIVAVPIWIVLTISAYWP